MKNKKYFDGGSILSLLGGATNLIPKDNAVGGAASGAINGASSLAALGPYGAAAGALIGGVAGGIQGNKQNMQNQINPYTQGISDRNNFLNIMADGGLIEYNTGGTHEQSPLGGIPQGYDDDGNQILTEKDETRLGDYVFPERTKITKAIAKEFNLPMSFIGKSFADGSKIYNKETKDRGGNDVYAKRTLDLNMKNLIAANESVLMKKNKNIFADGGYLSPSQYSQQMQSRDFNPAIPMLEPTSLMNSQIPSTEPILNTQLAGMPTTFLGTARKNWPIQDQNLLSTPNMPDRNKGINPQMVSEGQQARGYNQNVGNYLRDIGRIVNQSQASGDTRSQDEITRDIVGDYDKQPLTTMPFPKTFADGGPIKRGNIGDFYDPYNPSLPFEGYKPASGSDWTRRGYSGNDFNTQNEWVKGQLSPENIKMWLDPESELNKGVSWRQDYINTIKQQQPNLYSDLLAGKVPQDKLQELYTEKEVGPIQSLVDFPAKDLTSSGSNGSLKKIKQKDYGLAPMKNNVPNVGNPGTPPTNINVPNLWPEAGLLSAAPYMGLRPELANPTLMSTGYLKPQLTDEMTMRSGIDSANRANIGALTGATGGNAAALRAGLLGAGNNYMDATSNAFMQGNQANNQARMEADQFNIQNQTGVAGNNMGVLNQFELENKQLINNINAKKADEFANTMSDYVGNASTRRAVRELTNARANDIFNATGYAPTIPQTTMNLSKGTPGVPNHQLTWDEWNKSKNPQKLASDVNFSCGGVIKTRRRGLK